LLAFSDVVEEDRDVPLLGLAESERVDVVKSPEGTGRILKPARLPGQRDLPVDLEPVLLVGRRDLAHPAPNRAHNAGLLFEGAIDFQKAVVARGVRMIIEQHLDHAETLVDRIKQGAELFRGLARLPDGVLE
jgi:hypothetical protein